jgi:hypothetical protein
MKCPDCKGNKRIVLLISSVECERCNATGIIADVTIAASHPHPIGVVNLHAIENTEAPALDCYHEQAERENFRKWCAIENAGAPEPPPIKTPNLDALGVSKVDIRPYFVCDESHHARSRNFSYARVDALVAAWRHMLIVGDS